METTQVRALKLYIHAGYTKTGTTAIQGHFASYRTQYLDQGLLYPMTGLLPGEPKHYCLSFPFTAHASTSTPMQPRPAGFKAGNAKVLFEELYSEVIESSATSVLISSEEFFEIPKQKITELSEVIRSWSCNVSSVKIVFYLRRHDKWLESGFNQAEKITAVPVWGMSLFDYTLYMLGQRGTDYLNVLNDWASVFGIGNIIVRPYQKEELVNGSTIDDMCSLLEVIPHDSSQGKDADPNRSLSTAELYFVGLARRSLSPDISAKVVQAIMLQTASGDMPSHGIVPVGYGTFSEYQRNAIWNMYWRDYVKIARLYLGKAHLFAKP
ncbi:MAG: hypothetical protein QUV06_10220 [Cyanobium sp. CZS 48M]|nr:hypothetical protein [Cyanobium sp. CZS48M]